jgi:hypothetical protein
MNPKKQTQIEGDEISFIEALLFLKASGRNIVKCTLACLLAGGAYYLFAPAMYKASATIELAKVAGKPVLAPVVLMEKMKLPMYFSPSTQQICGADGELASTIKPSINRIAPMVTFVTHAQSTLKAKACLNAVIAEVSSNLDTIAKTLMGQKIQIRQQLVERLKLATEKFKNFQNPKLIKPTDEQISARTLSMALITANAIEINGLMTEISRLDREMIATETHLVSLASPLIAPETPTNKRPLFILGFCLSLGVILGLLVTGVMRVVPDIWRQMRKADCTEN